MWSLYFFNVCLELGSFEQFQSNSAKPKNVMQIVPEGKDYVEEMKDCRRELQLVRKKDEGDVPMFKEKMCINNCCSLFEKVLVSIIISIIINIYLLQVV